MAGEILKGSSNSRPPSYQPQSSGNNFSIPSEKFLPPITYEAQEEKPNQPENLKNVRENEIEIRTKFQLGFASISIEEIETRYRQLKESGSQKYEIINKLTSWAQKATSARGESIPYPEIFQKIKTFVNQQ